VTGTVVASGTRQIINPRERNKKLICNVYDPQHKVADCVRNTLVPVPLASFNYPRALITCVTIPSKSAISGQAGNQGWQRVQGYACWRCQCDTNDLFAHQVFLSTTIAQHARAFSLVCRLGGGRTMLQDFPLTGGEELAHSHVPGITTLHSTSNSHR
jgi:hypothetical protein